MSCFYSKVCKVKPLIRCSKKYLENIPPKTPNHQNIKPEKVDADKICWQNENNALPSSLLSRADKFNLLIRCSNKCFENYPLILPKLVNIKPVRDARYVEIAFDPPSPPLPVPYFEHLVIYLINFFAFIIGNWHWRILHFLKHGFASPSPRIKIC